MTEGSIFQPEVTVFHHTDRPLGFAADYKWVCLRNFVIRDFKIREATACRTRWLIKDWDYNAVVCAGKVKLRFPSRYKTTRLRNALYQCDSLAFLSHE